MSHSVTNSHLQSAAASPYPPQSPAAAALPLVTLKSLLENPTNSIASSRQYRKLLSTSNAIFSMNGKKDLAGLSSNHGSSLAGLAGSAGLGGSGNGNGGGGQPGWPVDHFESAAAQAFLGPSIWDKSSPYDNMNGPGAGAGHDFKLEYMDLDEFLSENGLGGGQATTSSGHGHHHGPGGSPLDSSCASPGAMTLGGRSHLALGEDNKVTSSTGSKERGDSPGDDMTMSAHLMVKDGMHMAPEMNGEFSPADLALATIPGSTHNFDPRRRRFSEEELKPQPMVKKSKKQFVPDDMKDEKYWARRRKNNLAAKRSRDARRVKENQIAIRAAYLEKENQKLREQLDKLTRENMLLRDKLTSAPKSDGKTSQ